jgi:hypothetical protein
MNSIPRADLTALVALALSACAPAGDAPEPSAGPMQDRLDQYATIRLTSDLSHLSAADREVVRLLIEAAEPMHEVFWMEAYGSRDSLLARIDDESTRLYMDRNVGPWDRLAGNEPFVAGIGPKPPGANFYPAGATAEQIEAAAASNPALKSHYTIVRRGEGGALVAVPYHEAFAAQHELAAAKLREAATHATDPGLESYLELRAQALLTDEYRASDMAWMDMKTNPIDVVIGPIESYEDQLLGLKTSHEAFVLIKDPEWSARLQRYAGFLPELQRGLPVPAEFKRETPGADADLNAYDVVFVAGDANAGSKTIAINLPNDEVVQLEKGTRRLQLKNAMRAKFETILVPLAEALIVSEQRRHVTFDAFFGNVMFHEVAHGLGIKNLVEGPRDGGVTVREALKEHYSAHEEGKADILGLYLVERLREQGEIPEGELADNYVTFVASIFRSIRFGASSAHGRANMVAFNHLMEQGGVTRDAAQGAYRVDLEKMPEAVRALSEMILTQQGRGDYEGVGRQLAERGVVEAALQGDLDRLAELGIPVDIVYEQGPSVLFANQEAR